MEGGVHHTGAWIILGHGRCPLVKVACVHIQAIELGNNNSADNNNNDNNSNNNDNNNSGKCIPSYARTSQRSVLRRRLRFAAPQPPLYRCCASSPAAACPVCTPAD